VGVEPRILYAILEDYPSNLAYNLPLAFGMDFGVYHANLVCHLLGVPLDFGMELVGGGGFFVGGFFRDLGGGVGFLGFAGGR
jgi:hypothetical protein